MYINTPMKIMNPEYEKIGVVPINIFMRDSIGCSLNLDQLDRVADEATRLIEQRDLYHDKIDAFVKTICISFRNQRKSWSQLYKITFKTNSFRRIKEKKIDEKFNETDYKERKNFWVTYFTFFLILAMPTHAWAYVDPATLTYVVQIIAGVFIAGGVAVGVYWRKIKKLFL